LIGQSYDIERNDRLESGGAANDLSCMTEKETPMDTSPHDSRPAGPVAWLRAPVNVTLPGWAVAAGAAALAALVLVALD
jgi:hypothetical protein